MLLDFRSTYLYANDAAARRGYKQREKHVGRCKPERTLESKTQRSFTDTELPWSNELRSVLDPHLPLPTARNTDSNSGLNRFLETFSS